MARNHETVGAPSISELDQAGHGRCGKCHEIYELNGEDLCGACLASPAVCRCCGHTFRVADLTDEELCEDCEPYEYCVPGEYSTVPWGKP